MALARRGRFHSQWGESLDGANDYQIVTRTERVAKALRQGH